MKLTGWAIALAAVLATPAVAQTARPTSEAPATSNAMITDPAGIGGAAQAASETGAPGVAQPVSQTGVNTLPPAASEPFVYAAPTPGVGVPVDGATGVVVQVTDVGEVAAAFHDNWLLLLCAVISLFVLALLGYAMVRFRRNAHTIPSRTSHNTTVEVLWTVIPVLILVAIAVPSIRLMRAQYSPPPADLTIKVIGNQWYWTYQYPDQGGFEIVSNMLKECDDPTLTEGQRCRKDVDGPPLLAVDERLVIPAGQTVKFLVTANDVIHSFGIPAFWAKIDANPGMINETWVKVERPGVYFGQCYELCGARHAYMPIAVEVVPPAQFAAWVASKGGTMPGADRGMVPAATPATGAPAATPVTPAEAEPAAPTPSVADRATAND